MAEANSKQNLITAVSMIVALVAVVYALTQHMDKTPEVAKPIAFIAGEKNPVVMSVNGVEVTRAEVIDNFNQSGAQLPEGANINAVFPMMQEQYLVGHLIYNAAKEDGIGLNNKTVIKQIQPALKNATRAAYFEKLSQGKVSEDDLKNTYETVVAGAPDQMERRASHILVKDKKKANALLIKAENSSDFAKLAIENSEGPSASKGGDLGYFTANEMVPEFSKAAFEGEVGRVVNTIVETQFGFHIIKVEDERQRAKPSFEDVKAQLRQQLAQAVIQEEIKSLRDSANVTLLDVNGNAIPEDAAVETPDVMPKETPTE